MKDLVIFQDFSKEDPNGPAQINKQFFILEDPERARDGNSFYTSGLDAPPTAGFRDSRGPPLKVDVRPSEREELALAKASPRPKLDEIRELRLELAPNCILTVAVTGDVALSTADVHALRAAAAPLVAELARRGLAAQNQETP